MEKRRESRLGAAVGTLVIILVVVLTAPLALGIIGIIGFGSATGGAISALTADQDDDSNGGKGCKTGPILNASGSTSSGEASSDAQRNNVRTIIGIGRSAGASETGIKIAIVASLKETGALNLGNDGVHGSEDDSGSWPAEGVDHWLAIAAKSRYVPNDNASYYNPSGGTDHDSIGIYQQRVSYWWAGTWDDPDGAVRTMMDPAYQAAAFFVGPHGDGGLKAKSDLFASPTTPSNAQVNEAVQAVQGAALGTVSQAMSFWDQANALYQANADAPDIAIPPVITGDTSGATSGGAPASGPSSNDRRLAKKCGSGGSGMKVSGDATGIGKAILEAAYPQDSLSYQWGGGDFNGPTTGQNKWPGVNGFDCSGLVLYAIYQATSGQVQLEHQSGVQEEFFRSKGWTVAESSGSGAPPEGAQPGDIAFFGGEHVAIYAGVVDGKPSYFQASWNYEAEGGNQADDIALSPIGNRVWTSWGRVNK